MLLTVIFDVSLDDLVKGDLVFMENELQNNDSRHKMNQYAAIMMTSFVLTALLLGGAFCLRGLQCVYWYHFFYWYSVYLAHSK